MPGGWNKQPSDKRRGRSKFAKGGMVSAYDKARQEKEQVEKEAEERKKKSGLRFTASFKKGGMVKSGRDYCK